MALAVERRDPGDLASIGSCTFSEQGLILRIDRSAARLLGIDADRPGEWRQVRFAGPDDRDAADRLLERLFGMGEPQSSDVRVGREDGTTAWVHLVAVTGREVDGRVIGLLAVEDVTGRRLADEAIAASERRLRSLFENVTLGAARCRVDWVDGRPVDWTYLEVNRAFVVQAGLPVAPGRRLSEVAPGFVNNNPALVEEYGRVAAGGPPYAFERYVASLDRWIEGNVLPAGPSEFFSVFRDITERKRIEESLRAGEERLRLLADASQDSIYGFDSEGRFTSANRQFCLALGLPEDQVVGRTPPEVGLPEDRFRELAAIHREVIAADATRLLEVEMLMPDGRTRLAEIVMNPMHDSAGRVVGIAEMSRDITDRRAAETATAALQAQLQQAQKMETVGRLAGGVAHDFNNMLGAILGNVELALEALPPSDPVRADLLEIQAAARRSADLTRQLLAFARRETIAPKVLDLNAAVAGTLEMLGRLIGEDIALAWVPADKSWPIRVDPSQVDQILTNLVVNARDAISDTGTVEIRTGTATLDADFCASNVDARPGDYVVLTVSDDGHGMDRDTLSHLFEPFFTTKGAGRGTGLGLATVYGIVRQNDGFIAVCSEPGAGTTVRVYLPGRAERLGASEGTPRPVSTRGGGETVLLVEDEPAILRLSTVMLERLGYRVIAAATPGDAIRLAREHRGEIDLLMTDVVMPEMNGRDLARSLSSLDPHMGRLFMSGYTADVIANRGVLDEGVHFLHKPFSTLELAVSVRQALDPDPRIAEPSVAPPRG